MKKFSGHKLYKFPTGHTLRSECEYPYKPPMKGGHSHNHVYNVCQRAIFRSSDGRKVGKGNKEFQNIFFMNLALKNYDFAGFIKVIFHGRRKK